VRLAILADVHANLEALTACLAHAAGQGVDGHVFAGDHVGYGADPGPVVDAVAEHAARGAPVVLGNHDAAVVAGRADSMHGAAAAAIAWTRGRLDQRQLAFLAGLPLTATLGDVLVVHASAEAPREWIYVTDPYRAEQCLARTAARWVFAGHVHEPVLYYATAGRRPVPFKPVPGVPIPIPPHRRWLAIAGSCGQPRDGSAAACYAVADLDKYTLTFHRVPYDHREAARKVRAAGLPETLAHRLERGT
jgi:diadenosine tetraphosphatase ApaH/serine/threonine PP2A family protein phosphatase